MKTVAIINPGTVHRYLHEGHGLARMVITAFLRSCYDRRFRWPSGGRCTCVPLVTLMNLCQLFENRGWSPVVFDEQTKAIDFSTNADLVCVTAVTVQYERAVWIARQFRKRGIPIAIGGVHASCVPETFMDDFDTVCVGEAEAYIDEMLSDLAEGRLKFLYKSNRTVSMTEAPFLRNDLTVGLSVPFHPVAFSRGCNNACEFCSIRMSLGRHRTRDVDSVVRHISETGARRVWFYDANLTTDREQCKALFRGLAPLDISWMSSSSLDACMDDEIVDLMAASGCWLLSLGFESLCQEVLASSGKEQNMVARYTDIIERLHNRGIAVEGNFVFGFDGQTTDAFAETAQFIIENGIDIPSIFMLTPYPDTPLFHRLDSQGRIVDRDWSHYENVHFVHLPVFEPDCMSRQELREGCRLADRLVYGARGTLRRLWNARTCRPSVMIANYINMRRMMRQGHLLPRIRGKTEPKLTYPAFETHE